MGYVFSPKNYHYYFYIELNHLTILFIKKNKCRVWFLLS